MQFLRHVVLFRVYVDVSDKKRARAIDLLNASRPPDVLEWHVGESLDARKGTVIIETATFPDAESLRRFRQSPGHIAAAQHLRTMADWLIGDYLVNETV